MFDRAQCIRDIGSAATVLCETIATFCQKRRGAAAGEADQMQQKSCITLLCMATHFGNWQKHHPTGSNNYIHDSIDDLATTWYCLMKREYNNMITAATRNASAASSLSPSRGCDNNNTDQQQQQDNDDLVEEAQELRSLFTAGVCAGRKQVNASELTSLFRSCADMAGVPALSHVDWDAYSSTFHLADEQGGAAAAAVPVEAATSILLRAWADVTCAKANWWVPAAAAAGVASTSSSSSHSPLGSSINLSKMKNSNTDQPQQQDLFATIVHSISYSVSPYLKIRFRISFPALLESELQETASTGYRVVRDVTLTFDDEEVLPGESIAPMVRLWKERMGFYGISEHTLQKSLLHLQKLVAASLKGEFLGTSKSSGAAPVQGHVGENFGSPSRVDPHKSSSAHFEPPTSSAQQQQQNPAGNNNTTKKSDTTAATTKKGDIGLLYRDPENALKDVDLQDADECTVKEYKEAMDEKFQETVLKPGMEGYEYDKRVEFTGPVAKSEWDDSDDD